MFLGALTYFNDAVSGTKQALKATQALLWNLKLVNTTAAAAYLQFHDKAAADVTVGTTTPKFCVRLAANESVNLVFERPIQFLTAVTIAGTTTATGSTGAAISVLAVYE